MKTGNVLYRFYCPLISLGITLDCGQAFRWRDTGNGIYTGIASKYPAIIWKEGDYIVINSLEGTGDFWHSYFDLERDYNKVFESFRNDPILNKAVEYNNKGIRVLNQEKWECTVSFIASQNNSINNIKRIINNLATKYGDRIIFEKQMVFGFPDPSKLAGQRVEEICETRCGYRADYIIDAAISILSGQVDLNKVSELPTQNAREELLRVKGIGRKVADCILLFSMGKMDVFPLDVWMKRVLNTGYGQLPKDKEIDLWIKDRFGEYAGIAQQYLFHYARVSGEFN